MNTKSQISDLRDRVSAASEGSRELDALLFWRFDEYSSERAFWNASTGPIQRADHSKPPPPGLGRAAMQACAPHYTSSTNAALALIERVKPADDLILSKHVSVKEIFWEAELGDQPAVEAPTPALALISALLQAVEGEGER